MREIFAQRSRELREKQGKTQMELARELHMDQSTLCKLQRGMRDPALDIIVQMAEKLHTSTDYLLGHADDANPAPLIGKKRAEEFAERPIAYFFSLLEPEEQDLLEKFLQFYIQCKSNKG